MASNPPIMAMATVDKVADPNAHVTRFIQAQRPFLAEYVAQGRACLERRLKREREVREAQRPASSESDSRRVPSEASRESLSVRKPGVVARMKARDVDLQTASQRTTGSPPLMTKKELDSKLNVSNLSADAKIPAKKRLRLDDPDRKKEVPPAKHKSILKSSTSPNLKSKVKSGERNRGNSRQADADQKVAHDRHDKEAETSDADREARLNARKLRRRERAAIKKPKECKEDEAKSKRKKDSHHTDGSASDVEMQDKANSKGKRGNDENVAPSKAIATKLKAQKAGRTTRAKENKGMALMAAFEADNIRGSGGRITVNPLRKGLFGRSVSSSKQPMAPDIRGRLRAPVQDLAFVRSKPPKRKRVDVAATCNGSDLSSASSSERAEAQARGSFTESSGRRQKYRDPGKHARHAAKLETKETQDRTKSSSVEGEEAVAPDIQYSASWSSELQEHSHRSSQPRSEPSVDQGSVPYCDKVFSEDERRIAGRQGNGDGVRPAPLDAVRQLLDSEGNDSRPSHHAYADLRTGMNMQQVTYFSADDGAQEYFQDVSASGVAFADPDHLMVPSEPTPAVHIEGMMKYADETPQAGNDDLSDISPSESMMEELEAREQAAAAGPAAADVLNVFGTTVDDIHRRLWRRRQR